MDYVTNSVFQTVVTNGTYRTDDAGCVTSFTYTGTDYTNETDLTWNGQYQLTGVDIDGSTVEAYRYDALGRRAQVISGTTTNHLVYDGMRVIAEADDDGDLLKTYTWGPGIDNLLAITVGQDRDRHSVQDRIGTDRIGTDTLCKTG